MKNNPSPHELKELYRWAVNNKPSDLAFELANMRSTFKMLAGNQAHLDSVLLIERQIRIVEMEIENLRRVVSNFDYSPINSIPEGPATNEALYAFINSLIEAEPEKSFKFNIVWAEYQRLISIYPDANDRKKFYLASEAFLRHH
jgi:hypothetical protein